MGGRRRPALKAKPARAPAQAAPPRPSLYTAQDVARFCEVDLKTIHHWADAGKIPHHRTEGRHLRFRRTHVVKFLLAHGYPLPDELTSARPLVYYAARAPGDEDLVKKLGQRFAVRRFDDAVSAIAHLVSGEPDALVLADDDPTIGFASAVAALRGRPDTGWPVIVLVRAGDVAEMPGVDQILPIADLPRLALDLARLLGVA